MSPFHHPPTAAERPAPPYPSAPTHRSTHLATTLKRTGTLLALALAAALSLAPLGVARAQNDLPTPTIQSTSLSDAQKQEIATYATAALALFKSENWADARRGRDQLLLPLSDNGASVAFRLEYSRLLTESLRAASQAGQPDIRRLNALRVLGAIATAQTTAPISDQLADPSPAIRFMATQAAASTFRTLATASPALPSGDAARLVTSLSRLAESEKDVMVFDGAIIAMVEATKVEQSGYTELRDAAFTRLAQSVGARIRALPTEEQNEAMISAILRAGIAARDGLSIARTEANGPVAKELAGFGGDLVAYVLRRAAAGQMPAAGSGTLRSALEQLVAVGEANIYFALNNRKLNPAGQGVTPTSLADTLKSGAADAEKSFADQATTLLRTTLTAAPLSFPADRFMK